MMKALVKIAWLYWVVFFTIYVVEQRVENLDWIPGVYPAALGAILSLTAAYWIIAALDEDARS